MEGYNGGKNGDRTDMVMVGQGEPAKYSNPTPNLLINLKSWIRSFLFPHCKYYANYFQAIRQHPNTSAFGLSE